MQFLSRNVGALSGVSSLYSGSASSGGDIQTFQESGHHPQEELPHPTVTQASPTGRITLLPSSALLLFVVILTTVSQTKMCICAPPVICIVNVLEHDKPDHTYHHPPETFPPVFRQGCSSSQTHYSLHVSFQPSLPKYKLYL